jgi:hypothetical protein
LLCPVARSRGRPRRRSVGGEYQGAGRLSDTSLRCDTTIRLDPLIVTEGHARLAWHRLEALSSPCIYRVEMNRVS